MSRPAGTADRRRPVDPARPPARVSRGLLVGLISGGGASAAHLVAGGHPSVVTGLVVALLAVGAGIAVSRWRVGLPTALGMALATQGTSHLLLAGSGAHDHAHTAPVGHGAAASGAVMVAAHLAIAVATALVARHADRVVLDLLRSLVSWFLPRTWPPRAPLARTRFPHPTDARLLPSYAGVRTPLSRRGPPRARLVLISP